MPHARLRKRMPFRNKLSQIKRYSGQIETDLDDNFPVSMDVIDGLSKTMG